MSDIVLVKTGGTLTDEQRHWLYTVLFGGYVDGFGEDDKAEWKKFWGRIKGLEAGEIVKLSFSVMRNGKFHRKFFAMLAVGYDAWEPPRKRKSYKRMPILKNMDQFREEVTILAGHYEQTFNLDGEMRLRAKSISFGNMDDTEFEKVYSSVATVLLQRVLKNYAGRAELDSVVERMLEFL